MRAAVRRGDTVFITTVSGLALDESGVYAYAERLQVTGATESVRVSGKLAVLRTDGVDIVWMRKEPPVDEGFIMATRLLDKFAEAVPVINSPRALREWNEKFSIFHFPELIAPTWAGTQLVDAVAFRQRHKSVVLKPMNGFGGRGVYVSLAGDNNFAAVFDLIGDNGKNAVMVQAYLPAGRDYDSRVFVVNGKPLDWMLKRYPSPQDNRGNLAAGSQPEAALLGKAERRIANKVGKKLTAAGILFAGLDVIDGKLIEINITCPTGLRQIRDMIKDDPAEWILAALS